MNIKENNGAIFLKFYGPIFSNCVSLEMLSKYNEIVFPFALLSQQSPALWPSCGRINSVLEFIVGDNPLHSLQIKTDFVITFDVILPIMQNNTPKLMLLPIL